MKTIDLQNNQAISVENAAELAGDYLETLPPYPETYQGRGIVTCAGGVKYNICAWVLIRMLRHVGCSLPIQVWYLDEEEQNQAWIDLARPWDVECVNAAEVCKQHPHPGLAGWPLKPYAILHCPFQEVLFLDSDNVPAVDPTFLFDDPRYQAVGAVFWPDCRRMPKESDAWRIFGIPYRDEPEQESGQILIDKRQCWGPLNLCNWYNERSEFFYQFVYGDKDTFRLAWHRAGRRFVMPDRDVSALSHALCQYDLDGRLLFQHRCMAKWSLGRNIRVRDFLGENQCLAFVGELRRDWIPVAFPPQAIVPAGCRRTDAENASDSGELTTTT
jgi:hypothetical protein